MAYINGNEIYHSTIVKESQSPSIEIVQETGDSKTAVMSQRAVTNEFNKYFSLDKSINRFDKSAPRVSNFIMGNGQLYTVDGYETATIGVEVSKTYTFPIYSISDVNVKEIACYDKDLTHLGRITGTANADNTLLKLTITPTVINPKTGGTVTATVAFVKVGVSTADIDSFMFAEGTEYPSEYIPFVDGMKVSPEVLPIAQTKGDDARAVMSQKAVTRALDAIVVPAIKQTTGDSETAVMSQKAITDTVGSLAEQVDALAVEVVQETGDSETAVMSQKAVSIALETKASNEDIAKAITDLGFEKETGSSTTIVTPVEINILEGLSIDYAVGSCWGESGLSTSQYTTGYTSVNTLIDILAGHTYKIPNFRGLVRLYDASGKNGTLLESKTIADYEFTVPEGKAKLGISCLNNYISSVSAVYLMTTITEEETELLSIKNDSLVVSPQNLQSDETIEYIRSLSDCDVEIVQTAGDSETAVMSQKAVSIALETKASNEDIAKAIDALGFEREAGAGTGTITPVEINILKGLSLTLTEGSCWGDGGGLKTNQYTTSYTSINTLIDVVAGQTYKIPDFYGRVLLYDSSGANGTPLDSKTIADYEFTVPEGKAKLGISYLKTPGTLAVLQMTTITEDGETLNVRNDKLVVMPVNLQNEQAKEFLRETAREVIPETPFVVDEDAFVPTNILEGKELTTTAKMIWNASGVLTSNYAGAYTAINELIDVVPGYTYKIPKYHGLVFSYDVDGKNGTNTTTGFTNGTDWVYTVPQDKAKIGIAYLTAQYSDVNKLELYLTTMTEEEQQALPLKSDKFSLQMSNIVKQDVKSLLCSLKDKTIVNFGDSIFGMFDAPTDISTVLAELTGATVYNCGFGGCRMAKHESDYYDPFSMYRLADAVVSGDFSYQDDALTRAQNDASQTGALVTKFPTTLASLKAIDFNKVDIVTIAYGTNDWQGGVALDNESNPKHTDYIAGALRYSIEKLLTKYPHLKVFICCPIYRCWNNADGTLNYDSDDASSAVNGVLLTDIVSKEEAVAKEYHLTFIDNYYTLGINKINRLNYFTIADGTHPNFDGRKIIAAHIAKELF